MAKGRPGKRSSKSKATATSPRPIVRESKPVRAAARKASSAASGPRDAPERGRKTSPPASSRARRAKARKAVAMKPRRQPRGPAVANVRGEERRSEPRPRRRPDAPTPKPSPSIPAEQDTLPQGTEPTRTQPAPAKSASAGDTIAVITQLDWNDVPREPLLEGLVQRWARRGEDLLRRLTEQGAANHEVRADLRQRRFMWIDPDGRVSAEAHAQVVCSWSRATSVVAMGWTDPLVRGASIPRVDGMPSERDDVDEEKAWRIAMEAAEASGAEYLHRVPTPHAWYFLALRALSFAPSKDSFHPGTPVGLVLKNLGETRRAVETKAEPADVVRERLKGIGSALLHQAQYAYRGTDWVARLTRSGRRLTDLSGLIPRESYGSVAAGRPAEEWLAEDLGDDLVRALRLLEDEWNAFC